MTDLTYFLLASITLTLIPGPDFMMVLTLSLTRGSKSAMTFALGLCSGLIFHIMGATLGLGLLLKASPALYQWVKTAGLIYLCYLGLKSIALFAHQRKVEIQDRSVVRLKRGHLYRQGILMNILNPKVTLFFLSFFPQWIKPTDTILSGPVFLGLLFIAQAITIFFLVTLIASKLKGVFTQNVRATHLIEGLLYFVIAFALSN